MHCGAKTHKNGIHYKGSRAVIVKKPPSGRVGLEEQLAGRLSERLYLVLDRFPHDRVHVGLQVDRALVREVVEHVDGAHRLRALLLVAEYQVDPLVQLAGNKLRLQRLRAKEGLESW